MTAYTDDDVTAAAAAMEAAFTNRRYKGDAWHDGAVAVLAAVAPQMYARWEANRDECRHESMTGDPDEPRMWRCDSCTYWYYGNSLADERARTLREAAEWLREWFATGPDPAQGVGLIREFVAWSRAEQVNP